jgi:hypothetical protein
MTQQDFGQRQAVMAKNFLPQSQQHIQTRENSPSLPLAAIINNFALTPEEDSTDLTYPLVLQLPCYRLFE